MEVLDRNEICSVLYVNASSDDPFLSKSMKSELSFV
jgi:hypothetical protein